MNRFLHDPKATEGFVGCALFANVFRFFKTADGSWDAEKVIDIPNKKVGVLEGQSGKVSAPWKKIHQYLKKSDNKTLSNSSIRQKNLSTWYKRTDLIHRCVFLCLKKTLETDSFSGFEHINFARNTRDVTWPI